MTSLVVTDAGVFLAAVLVESHTAQARQLIRQWNEQGIQISAPTLFLYEIVATIRKSVSRRRLTAEEAREGLDLLLAYPVRLHMDDNLLRRAYDLATRLNRPTAYDSQYLAVAEWLSCELWTADERLFRAVGQELGWVRWLGDFTG